MERQVRNRLGALLGVFVVSACSHSVGLVNGDIPPGECAGYPVVLDGGLTTADAAVDPNGMLPPDVCNTVCADDDAGYFVRFGISECIEMDSGSAAHVIVECYTRCP